MGKEFSRRRLLQLGTTGLIGLAGCSSTDNQTETPLVTSTKPGSQRSPTSTTTPSNTETTPEPIAEIDHDKLIGAQYYAWYWGDDGFGGHSLASDNPNSWLSATPGAPSLSTYDSRHVGVINQHMRWCLENGINWWIITGGAPNGRIDRTIRNVVFEADYADQMNFTLLIGFPPEIRDDDGQYDFDDPQAEPLLKRWFTHWADHYVPDSNYLRLGNDGRPALYFWSTSGAKGDMPGVFQTARDAVDVNPYIIGGPDYYRQPRRMKYNAATFDAVLDYHSYFPNEEFLNKFETRVVENHHRWRAAAHEYDLEFIPTVTPGFNHTEAPATFRDDRLLPTLERSADRFRKHCQQLRGLGDHDAIVITSFNEWPEHSAIEPSKEYGETYLDIVANELGQSEWESPPITPFTPVVLEFDDTVTPAETNSDSTDSRHLAVRVDELHVETSDGKLVVDVGGKKGKTFYTEGVYGPESNNNRTWRWFGGEDAQSRTFLPTSDISDLTFVGQAITDEITTTIRAGDTSLGTVTVNDAWGTYTVS